MKRTLCILTSAVTLLVTGTLFFTAVQAGEKDEGWISLFNGKDLSGWRISDKDQAKWRVEDGMIVANGPRSHLFTEKQFKDFEFRAEVKTTKGSNSGIYFHTKYQETGWPEYGYECQVNVSHRDPVKTGSLYGVVKRFETPAKDDQWNDIYIRVKGKHILIKVNGQTTVDYTEGDKVDPKFPHRRLSRGSIALQAHDPGSVVYYRNLRIRPLD